MKLRFLKPEYSDKLQEELPSSSQDDQEQTQMLMTLTWKPEEAHENDPWAV